MTNNRIKTGLFLVLIFMGLGSTAFAQRHGGYYHSRPRTHSHYSGNNVYHTVRAIEGIAETTAFAHSLHMLDDYTGFRLGYNSASFRLSGFDEANLDSDIKPGINLGLVFGWNLGHSPIIFEPGIYYSMKGGSLKGRNIGYGDHDRSVIKTTMHMLEIPAVFKLDLSLPHTGISIQPFVGGFMAFGLGGQSKDSGGHDSYETFGEDTDQFDTFDAGFRTGVGMAISRLYVELAYDLGLVNLPNNEYRNWGYDDGFDDAIRSRCVSLSIGFNF